MLKVLNISCLCGRVKNAVAVSDPRGITPAALCHCYGCRHTTGQLYASYCGVQLGADEVEKLLADGALTELTVAHLRLPKDVYQHHDTILYFCSTCGCHVYRRTESTQELGILDIASGTISSLQDETPTNGSAALAFGPHINANGTQDGGVAKFIGHVPGVPDARESNSLNTSQPELFVPASCLCKGVQLHITPPSPESFNPKSGFSDMIIPFHTQDPRISNPDDEKWWLRCDNTKYMAGLCACRSCRLSSGFELQSWAFIPRVNILQSSPEPPFSWTTLDFDALRAKGTLRSHESSPGVMREFCSLCGATVFWHDKWRSELIDVSVGLLDSARGGRAEGLLDWCLERVSFAEDSVLGRDGSVRDCAKALVENVEKNMKTLSLAEVHP
ncbi:hypothetical protein NLG97_g9368 [Lecanicillium saksenae]|uniref:Uncharacterized protein n=1 Tax=Lecanicillium saksenae TaxID=468837 RepID=A0ACC1QIP9_9HYPO|nr:hypothetical protein NLG97_g9368 [Lecanicillium saksenae]